MAPTEDALASKPTDTPMAPAEEAPAAKSADTPTTPVEGTHGEAAAASSTQAATKAAVPDAVEILASQKASDADASPKLAPESPGEAEQKPDARRASKEPAAGRRVSKERPGPGEAEAGEELPEVTAIEIANDAKMSKEILQLIRDLDKKKQWVLRGSALRRLQGLVIGGAVGKFPAFLKAIKSTEFASATKDLFSDLRSQLVKEASDAILRMAKAVVDAGVMKEYDQYFTDVVLVEGFRAVCKANSTIVLSADACLKGLVHGFHSLRMLRGVVEPMCDSKANSRLRLQCAQLLTIILESWSSDKLSKGSLDIGNKRIDALDAMENGILKSLSDTKSDTRTAAKVCHDKYVILFPTRAPQLLERMNRQQLRVVREGEPEADSEDKIGAVPKRKARVSSISPERNPSAPTHAKVSEAERQKRKRDKDLAERARARGAAKGDGGEVDPAEALVLAKGELSDAKDKLEEVEKQLVEEKRKSKNLHKLKEEAVKSRDQEKQALEMVLETHKEKDADGESDAAKDALNREMEDKIKDLVHRLKKEQARARKMMEERDDWQRKCKVAESSLDVPQKNARGEGKEGSDKKDKPHGRKSDADDRGGEGDKKGGGKKGEKKSIRQEKEETDSVELVKQLEVKNLKLLDKMKRVKDEFGLLEEEKTMLEEKLAEFESKQERAGVELDVKGGELRQVRERWQVREKDWFEARMNLERDVESLKAELHRRNAKTAAWSEERLQMQKRIENFRARLGEDEDGATEREYDEYSPAALVRRKEARDRGEGGGRASEEQEWSDDGGGGGDDEVRQLKIELEQVKQNLMRQEAMAGEARATASMAQQELQHWRQRVTDMEPERNRATHMADKLRAELEWRGRVQGQEERRLRSHAQHAEEGRRRVEAQLAYVSMELQRGQGDVAQGLLTPETIIKKIEVLVNEESQRVKMHRNADVFLSADVGIAHPMYAHHAVAPPLFPPTGPPSHGWGGGGGFGQGGVRAPAAHKGLPWVAFDVDLGKDHLPVIVPGGGGGRGVAAAEDNEGNPLKKRQVKPARAGR